MKKKPKLSYESDGVMGTKEETKDQVEKEKKKKEHMFFNTTQESE
jgi:hypothetical protein